MPQEDPERCSSGFFGSAGVDGGLSDLDELSDLFDVEIIALDGADDFFNLFGFGLSEIFGGREPLENGHGSYGEGVLEGRFLQFREDDGEKGENLTLEVFSFCHEFVTEFGEFPEGLDKFFGDLALDVFSRSQELGDDQGIDVIGFGLFG
jgi:hypothetical protein